MRRFGNGFHKRVDVDLRKREAKTLTRETKNRRKRKEHLTRESSGYTHGCFIEVYQRFRISKITMNCVDEVIRN